MAYGIVSALPMLVCLFWTLTLTLGIRQGGRARGMLTVWMGTATVLYFCHWVYFNHGSAALPVTDTIYALCTLSVYPLWFLYIKLLTESRKLQVRDFGILIPAVVSCTASAVIYAMMGDGEMAAYIEKVIYGQAEAADVSALAHAQALRYRLAGVVNVILIVYVLWHGSRKIARYNREIENYYSNTEGKTFSEIRRLLVWFVATSLTSSVMHIIGKEHFADSTWMLLVPSLLFGSLLYALGYIGDRHGFTAADFVRDLTRGDQQEEADDSESPRNLPERIRKLIERKELFRQPDIKVSDIAALLHTNRSYISAAINREMDVSFSELINGYRIEYAKDLIVKSKAEGLTLTKADIIEMSGFTNESSFHRTFKSFTGTTPQKWFAEQAREK